MRLMKVTPILPRQIDAIEGSETDDREATVATVAPVVDLQGFKEIKEVMSSALRDVDQIATASEERLRRDGVPTREISMVVAAVAFETSEF